MAPVPLPLPSTPQDDSGTARDSTEAPPETPDGEPLQKSAEEQPQGPGARAPAEATEMGTDPIEELVQSRRRWDIRSLFGSVKERVSKFLRELAVTAQEKVRPVACVPEARRVA